MSVESMLFDNKKWVDEAKLQDSQRQVNDLNNQKNDLQNQVNSLQAFKNTVMDQDGLHVTYDHPMYGTTIHVTNDGHINLNYFKN